MRGHRAPEPAVLDFDRDHLWHPYSPVTRPGAPYLVESASGTRLRLRVDGEPREVIDAMASWWCAIHGYAVPELDAAAREQLDRMSHVMFGGLTHSPAVELARRLVGLAPGSAGGGEMPPARALTAPRPTTLDKVFLADSGSVAVEVAMKMAWQAQPGRRRMFTIRGGYHGDTFGCMSVCDPDGGMHAMYGGLLPRHLFAPRPPAGLDADLTGCPGVPRAGARRAGAGAARPVSAGIPASPSVIPPVWWWRWSAGSRCTRRRTRGSRGGRCSPSTGGGGTGRP